VEQGFHNHGKKNQRLNYDLGELDVVKEVARTPNKVLLATWVYLFCEVLFFFVFFSLSFPFFPVFPVKRKVLRRTLFRPCSP
jgi:hypothetical protein